MNSGVVKKIAIINFHYAHNYGAVLESLALKTALEKMGHLVNVIDYRPYYQEQYYIAYPDPFKAAYWRYKGEWRKAWWKRVMSAVKWGLITVRNYIYADKRRAMIGAFTPFVNKHLKLTKRYSSLTELKNSPPEADCYICGSDQIWNPKVTYGLDPAYFLSFGDKYIRRIAYAPSPCAALDVSYFGNKLNEFLPAFYMISLREEEKKAELERIYGKEIAVCVDPTLLLNEKDYAPFEEEISEREPFILVYAFLDKDNSLINSVLKQVQQHFQLRVVDISYERIDWDVEVERKSAITPGQFLRYFKQASYLVTNSFHGTAFSLIYKKQFKCVPKSGTGQRMLELLKKLNAEDSIAESTSIATYEGLSYCEIDNKIETLKSAGKRYLEKALLE